jgi:general secretion pathway protein L
MATCFIFTQYLQENGCLITRFNDKGEQDIEAKHYSFVEIAKLQEGYKTIIVYPCNWTSLLELELPWLAERKARAAIPYALEDQLTQPIEILHFAFDKQRYRNGRYEIVVLEKQKLIDLINTVLAEGIEFDIITLDWFALSVNESIFIEDTAIIDSKEFKGPLSPELAVVFQSVFNECTNYIFQDSKPGIELPNKQEIAEKSYLWLSKRLLENKPLNLCQGALQHGTSSLQILKGYRFLAGFAGLWLIIMLGVNAYKLHVVNTQLEDTNQKIALIYKQFFPDAKQIINPKFRISQLLGDT